MTLNILLWKNIDVDEHQKLSNITHRHKLKTQWTALLFHSDSGV